MSDQYLYGRLTVCFGSDMASLEHEVFGRLCYSDILDGDKLEVLSDDEGYKELDLKEIFSSIVNQPSKYHTKWNEGQSLYEGVKARVLFNQNNNKTIRGIKKRKLIRELFRRANFGEISLTEIEETIFKWEARYEDD